MLTCSYENRRQYNTDIGSSRGIFTEYAERRLKGSRGRTASTRSARRRGSPPAAAPGPPAARTCGPVAAHSHTRHAQRRTPVAILEVFSPRSGPDGCIDSVSCIAHCVRSNRQAQGRYSTKIENKKKMNRKMIGKTPAADALGSPRRSPLGRENVSPFSRASDKDLTRKI